MSKKKKKDGSHLTEEKLKLLVRKKAERFLSTRGVTSVGVGYKWKGDKQTDQLCIQFTVKEKLAPEMLEAAGTTLLPEFITDDEGNEIPCDVVERSYKPSVQLLVESREVTARQVRRRRQDPVFPGISVSHKDGTAGTLGAVVYDASTGDVYMLSNWHVLHTSEGQPGDTILQPGPFDGGTELADTVGQLVRSHLGLAGDCAVATVEGRGTSAQILELDSAPLRMGLVNLNDKVVKSGRTSGITFGIVTRVGVVVNLDYGGETGVKQIGGFEVRPNPDKPAEGGEISQGGDSGSVWMMDQDGMRDVAVGLHFAGETDPDPEAEHALACNIHSVLEKLQISFTRPVVEGIHRDARRGFLMEASRSKEQPADDEGLTLQQLAEMERIYADDPQALLQRMQRVVYKDVTEEQLLSALSETRQALERPQDARRALEARFLFEQTVALPAGFQFPGMDLQNIPIDAGSRKFETLGDLVGWILFAGGPIVAGIQKAPFRYDPNMRFQYNLQEPSAAHPLEIALFSDWGTGLYHSRYIAKQFQQRQFPYAIHLGDVYYAGRRSEFHNYVRAPLDPILPNTEVFLLNSNHEMYSGAAPYFEYLDDKLLRFPQRQRQTGSYFALRTSRFQIIGIDTAYHDDGRFRNAAMLGWLDRRLNEGRSNGQANILLSANEPYEYGEGQLTDLFNDLAPVLGDRVDLWFWGNTHYCALFDRSPATPFVGSCIGHAGYPYGRFRLGKPTPAPLRFLEAAPRFPSWTNVRQDRGNNGYCVLMLRQDGSAALTYTDWMTNTRCIVELARTAGDRLQISRVDPRPFA